MTLLKIAQIGHPVLRQIATEVPVAEIQSDLFQQFLDDLVDTMRDARGAGLAAPQVYRGVRACVIEVADNPRYPYKPRIPLTVLINPVLTPLSEDTFSNFEGCLSVPNLRGRTRRYCHMRLRAFDRQGHSMDQEIRGISAGTFQHEIDHLDGKLFVDSLESSSSLCTTDQFDRYEKDRFIDEVQSIVTTWGS